jgi:hypothetical protein
MMALLNTICSHGYSSRHARILELVNVSLFFFVLLHETAATRLVTRRNAFVSMTGHGFGPSLSALPREVVGPCGYTQTLDP